MKKLLFLILFIAMVSSIYGKKKYIHADIEYKNGTVKTGYVGFPIGCYAKKISFKSTIDAKAQKMIAKDISTITFANNNDMVQLVHSYGKLYKSKKEKLSKNQVWTILKGNCKGLYLLEEASYYKINRDLELILVYKKNHTPFLYLLREGEKYAAAISIINKFPAISIGVKAYFRRNARKFFIDNPTLIEKINNKDFKGDIYSLFTYYCQNH